MTLSLFTDKNEDIKGLILSITLDENPIDLVFESCKDFKFYCNNIRKLAIKEDFEQWINIISKYYCIPCRDYKCKMSHEHSCKGCKCEYICSHCKELYPGSNSMSNLVTVPETISNSNSISGANSTLTTIETLINIIPDLHPQLVQLDIEYSGKDPLQHKIFKALEHPFLQIFILRSSTIDSSLSKEIFNSIKNSSIHSLNLEWCELGSDESVVDDICELIIKNEKIKSLHLEGNRISCRGVSKIGEYLEKNYNIRSLNLGGNEFGFEGASSLFNSLSKHSEIRDLYLYCCNFKDDIEDVLSKFLTVNKSIIFLDLSVNNLRRLNFHAVAHSSLQTLIIDANQLGEDCIKSLSIALRGNTSLKYLSLAENYLGDICHDISEALPYTRITRLNLSNNAIYDNILESFIRNVNKSKYLRTLILYNNMVTTYGLQVLLSNLHENTSLEHLDLSFNRIESIPLTLTENEMPVQQYIAKPSCHVDIQHILINLTSNFIKNEDSDFVNTRKFSFHGLINKQRNKSSGFNVM